MVCLHVGLWSTVCSLPMTALFSSAQLVCVYCLSLWEQTSSLPVCLHCAPAKGELSCLCCDAANLLMSQSVCCLSLLREKRGTSSSDLSVTWRAWWALNCRWIRKQVAATIIHMNNTWEIIKMSFQNYYLTACLSKFLILSVLLSVVGNSLHLYVSFSLSLLQFLIISLLLPSYLICSFSHFSFFYFLLSTSVLPYNLHWPFSSTIPFCKMTSIFFSKVCTAPSVLHL